DSDTALRLLKALGQFQLRVSGELHGGARPGKLVVRSDEYPDLGGGDSVRQGLLDPVGDAFDLAVGIAERLDLGIWAVEHRDRAAPILLVLVNVLHGLRHQPVGGLPDLVRRSVIDLERARAPANIDAKLLPRKRFLEDALPKVA